MEFDKDILNLIIAVIVILATVVGPLVDRWRKRKTVDADPAEVEPDPAETKPEEPRLPYEEVVDQLFGPYMERRRREAEERARQQVIIIEEEEPEAATPPPVPEEAPAAPIPVAPPVEPPPARSLEDRIFKGRALSPAARLVLSAEIMRPPRFSLRRLP